MARVVDELLPPRSHEHPWAEWLDGQKWELHRKLADGSPPDYQCDERVLADLAYNAARRRKLKVTVRYSRDHGITTLQAFNRDGSAIVPQEASDSRAAEI